ncbi:MAG TPA: M23 family metallopeptidase [Roseivirga sp.]
MKKKITLILCFLSFTTVFAQEIPVRNIFTRQGFGYYDQNERKIIHQDMPYDVELYSPNFQRDMMAGEETIWAKNISSGYITLVVIFERFLGVMSTEPLPFVRAFGPGPRRLLTLKPTSTAQPDYNYVMYYCYGYANPEVKEIDYALPFNNLSNIKAVDTKYVAQKEYSDKESEFYGTNFIVPEGSEIIASRGGLVVFVEDQIAAGAGENRISIIHPDGTVGNYLGLAKGSAKVKVGDEILMGAPLASAQTNDNDGIQLMFSLSYLKVQADLNKDISQWSSKVYFKPAFHAKENTEVLTSGNVYSSYLDDEMITQDMSRKDKKAFLKNK